MAVKILVLAAVLALAACQTASGDFCDVASPIRLSASVVDAMSDREVDAVLSHNEKLEKLCRVKP